MAEKNNLKSLNQFIEEQFGPKGTANRDKFEKDISLLRRSFLLKKTTRVVVYKEPWDFNQLQIGKDTRVGLQIPTSV